VKGLQGYDEPLPWHIKNSKKQAYSFWTKYPQQMFDESGHTKKDGPTLDCSNFNPEVWARLHDRVIV
jgi:hypothetical protein